MPRRFVPSRPAPRPASRPSPSRGGGGGGGSRPSPSRSVSHPAPTPAPRPVARPFTRPSSPTQVAQQHSFVQGTPAQYKPIIAAAAQKHGIPAQILSALLKQESGFNPKAQSPVGAKGIAQFMDSTAASYGINPMNPAQAIDGAARYLADAQKIFGNDWSKVIASYNAGVGAVQKYGGVPPYAETQNYVQSILSDANNAISEPVKALEAGSQTQPPASQQAGKTIASARTKPGASGGLSRAELDAFQSRIPYSKQAVSDVTANEQANFAKWQKSTGLDPETQAKEEALRMRDPFYALDKLKKENPEFAQQFFGGGGQTGRVQTGGGKGVPTTAGDALLARNQGVTKQATSQGAANIAQARAGTGEGTAGSTTGDPGVGGKGTLADLMLHLWNSQPPGGGVAGGGQGTTRSKKRTTVGPDVPTIAQNLPGSSQSQIPSPQAHMMSNVLKYLTG